jgi:hypothetical protein
LCSKDRSEIKDGSNTDYLEELNFIFFSEAIVKTKAPLIDPYPV